MTRPQALQETFEICADVVTTKLESYFKQADEYHNNCLQGAMLWQLASAYAKHLKLEIMCKAPR